MIWKSIGNQYTISIMSKSTDLHKWCIFAMLQSEEINGRKNFILISLIDLLMQCCITDLIFLSSHICACACRKKSVLSQLFQSFTVACTQTHTHTHTPHVFKFLHFYPYLYLYFCISLPMRWETNGEQEQNVVQCTEVIQDCDNNKHTRLRWACYEYKKCF